MSRLSISPSARALSCYTAGLLLLAGLPQLSFGQAKAKSPVQLCLESVNQLRTESAPKAQAAAQAGNSAGAVEAFAGVKSAAKGCEAKGDPAALNGADLGAYGTIQVAAGDYDAGIATIRRFMKDTSVALVDRSSVLETSQRLAVEGTTSTVDIAKRFVDLADSVNIPRPRLNTRILLAQLYRTNPQTFDKSYPVIRDIITIAKEDPDTTTRERRAKPLGQMVKMATQWAQQDGRQYDAQVILDQAEAVFGKYQSFKQLFHPEALIGSAAPAILAPKWLNASNDMAKQSFGDGKMYLVEFTAHWCGPCRASYSAIERLVAKHKELNVIMATQLFGYYGEATALKPAAELDSLKGYFAEHKVGFPVAVVGAFEGVSPEAAQNVNFVNYNASGLPTVVLIDGKGVVRGFWQGWGDEAEGAVEAAIAKVVADAGSAPSGALSAAK